METNGNNASLAYDYVIIGAGPAGLQLGYYLAQAGRSYLILEAGDTPGTFFKRFPRHRKLISINKIYTGRDDHEINLRWDWNSLLSDSEERLFKHYSKRYFPGADDMVRYLCDFAAYYDLNIRYGARVVGITKDDRFRIADSQGVVYSCRWLIVATGFTKPYIPPIPGIELVEHYTEISIAPDEFANQRVLIIGKGNSAFETADNLIETAAIIHLASPHGINMAWRTHFVGHVRAVNNNILDTYQLKSQNAMLDAEIDKIERKGEKFAVSFSYMHANGEQEELIYDRVIACTGFRFDDSLFDDTCRPELTINNRFPKQTSAWEATNVKDLYFAGTLMQMRDYRKTTSGFIHGFRYNIRALHRLFEHKHHREEWPSRPVSLSLEGLVEAVIKRANTSSALWQQFGFLCDVIAISDRGSDARYYEEIPVDYALDTKFRDHDHYYTITLEYGPNHVFEDPFNVNRIRRNDTDSAHLSNFLHPVVRRFSGPTLIAVHHIIEDLMAEWVEEEHINPLLEFFSRELPEQAQAEA